MDSTPEPKPRGRPRLIPLARQLQTPDPPKKTRKIYKKRNHFISINPRASQDLDEKSDSNYFRTPPRNDPSSCSSDMLLQQVSHLNPQFPLPDQQLSDYLLCYQYAQNQRCLVKEMSDPAFYDTLSGQALEAKTPSSSQQLCNTFAAKSRACLEAKSQPFDRLHMSLRKQLRQLTA